MNAVDAKNERRIARLMVKLKTTVPNARGLKYLELLVKAVQRRSPEILADMDRKVWESIHMTETIASAECKLAGRWGYE